MHHLNNVMFLAVGSVSSRNQRWTTFEWVKKKNFWVSLTIGLRFNWPSKTNFYQIFKKLFHLSSFIFLPANSFLQVKLLGKRPCSYVFFYQTFISTLFFSYSVIFVKHMFLLVYLLVISIVFRWIMLLYFLSCQCF